MELESNELGHLPPGPTAAPWMVFNHETGMKDQTFFNLCEPKTYKKCIPELSGKSFWQSPSNQGWLIVLCNNDDDDDTHYSNSSNKCKSGDCFLWNPAALETIQLPTMSHLIGEGAQYHLVNAVLSSSPITNPNGKSTVLFLFDRNKSYECIIVFCRPTVDKVWRMLEVPTIGETVGRVFFFNGKFYISKCPSDDCIEEIEVILGNDNEPVVTSTRVLKATHLDVSTRLGMFPVVLDYYVDSCDELFRVVQIFHPKFFEKEVFAIEIFRFDFYSLNWVEVKRLGDHVFFLGAHTTVSCSATEMGLTRGCVYFTLSEDMSLYKFDPEEDIISVSLPCLDMPAPKKSADWIMIIPTVMIRADGDGSRKMEDISSTTNMKEECIILKDKEEEKRIISINIDEKVKKIQKNSNKSKLEKPTCWDMLHDEMVALIATHLHPVDLIHFRMVSKANRLNVASKWRTASTSKIIPATSLSPWLVFLRKDDPAKYNFTDPMHNEKYLMDLSEFEGKIRFSKGGWLLMSSGRKTLFFFNPFTREKIQLPDLPGIYEYMFYGISFSSLPTSLDCIVFAITELSQGGEHYVFIFFISRGDTSWSYHRFNNPRFCYNGKLLQFVPWFNTPIFYNGGFYCLDYCGTLLGVFYLKDNFSWKVFASPNRHYSSVTSIYQTFLVECDGKLLCVFLGHLGSWLWIFRVDFSKNAWVKVESLGKHMLFISHTSCLSAVAPKSCMENKIYLSRFHGEGVFFYSLATSKYHAVGSQHSAQDFNDTREQLNCSWIEPNWSRATAQEQLDWLKRLGDRA